MVPAAAAEPTSIAQSSASAVDAAAEPAAVAAIPTAVSASLCQVRRPWMDRADQLLRGQRGVWVYELHQAKRVPLAMPRRLPPRLGLSTHAALRHAGICVVHVQSHGRRHAHAQPRTRGGRRGGGSDGYRARARIAAAVAAAANSSEAATAGAPADADSFGAGFLTGRWTRCTVVAAALVLRARGGTRDCSAARGLRRFALQAMGSAWSADAQGKPAAR